MTDQPQSLAAALADLQQHLPRIAKAAEGQAGARHFKYADLAPITRILLPMLAERGMYWTCNPTMHDGQFVMEYVLGHVVDESTITGRYPLPSSTPQTMGGAITYARRYCLLAVTGAAPDDDDDAQEAEAAARAQRNHAPEVRADGSAMEAELERMRTGHEPGTWRSGSTAENDPFYDQSPPVMVEDRPGTIDRRQLSIMHAKFTALNITDREARLRWTEIAIGRQVPSANDLSFREAGTLLEALAEEARERSKT